MRQPRKMPARTGQESVWDYPRPPRIEAVERRIRIEHGGRTIVDAPRAWRMLETSHPPVYYVAPDTVAPGALRRNEATSSCEFKGRARYWDLLIDEQIVARDVAWSYPQPLAPYAAITDHLAFYAGRVDACYVGDERVQAQAGDFYGGWITANIVGPFKGEPGTCGW